MYNSAVSLLKKVSKNIHLTESETLDLKNLPSTLLVCYLNGFDEALDRLTLIKDHLKENYPNAYRNYKEVMRIQRKIKY